LGAGDFAAFANGVGDFTGFAEADTDTPVFVTDNDEGTKIETASAFDDFGGAVDEHDFFDEFLAGLGIERRFGLRASAPSAGTWASLLVTTALLLGARFRLRFDVAICFGCFWICHSAPFIKR